MGVYRYNDCMALGFNERALFRHRSDSYNMNFFIARAVKSTSLSHLLSKIPVMITHKLQDLSLIYARNRLLCFLHCPLQVIQNHPPLQPRFLAMHIS